jgi:hypothetical protein
MQIALQGTGFYIHPRFVPDWHERAGKSYIHLPHYARPNKEYDTRLADLCINAFMQPRRRSIDPSRHGGLLGECTHWLRKS